MKFFVFFSLCCVAMAAASPLFTHTHGQVELPGYIAPPAIAPSGYIAPPVNIVPGRVEIPGYIVPGALSPNGKTVVAGPTVVYDGQNHFIPPHQIGQY